MIKSNGEITNKRCNNSDAVAIIASQIMYPTIPQMRAVATIKSQCSEKLKLEADPFVIEEAMRFGRVSD